MQLARTWVYVMRLTAAAWVACRMNHTATSHPLELGMPPGVAGCLQMLMAHPSEYVIDELWTRLHKLYVSCDTGGSRVRWHLG